MAVVDLVPFAGRDPAFHGKAPQWWNSGAAHGYGAGEYSDRIDDPRWVGCLKYGVASGSLTELFAFRALYTAGADRFLYLSFHVEEDPMSAIDRDTVQVGLHTGTGSPSAAHPAYAIKISLNATAATGAVAGGSGYYSSEVLKNSGSGWASVTLPWISTYTRVWVINSGTADSTWAVHMLIPVAAEPDGLPLGATFGLCYYVGAFNGTSGQVVYDWSAGTTTLQPTTSGGTPSYLGMIRPAAAQFNPCALGTPAVGDTARTGLALYERNIGTIGVTNRYTHVVDPQAINVTTGVPTTFFARPINEDPDPAHRVPEDSIGVVFKLANWGSMPPAGVWTEICRNPIPPAGPSHPAFEATAPDNAQTLTANWTPTLDESNFYNTNYHQCMLAELSLLDSSAMDPSLFFSSGSASRNMDFVGASLASIGAEISVAGLPIFSVQPRDVYIFVKTKNMPVKLDDATLKKYDEAKELLPKVYPPGADDAGAAARNLPVMMDGENQGLSYAEFEQVIPTYRCFVYHDTGRRIEVDGEIYPVLKPQPSFGHHVWHEGSFVGWDLRLQGAEKLAENIYIVRVPNNGSAKITTLIQAVEPGEQRQPEEPIHPRPKYTQEDGCMPLLESLGPLGKVIAALLRRLSGS